MKSLLEMWSSFTLNKPYQKCIAFDYIGPHQEHNVIFEWFKFYIILSAVWHWCQFHQNSNEDNNYSFQRTSSSVLLNTFKTKIQPVAFSKLFFILSSQPSILSFFDFYFFSDQNRGWLDWVSLLYVTWICEKIMISWLHYTKILWLSCFYVFTLS